MNGQIDLKLVPELKKLAEDAAKATNMTSEEALKYIIEAVKRDYEWRMKAREVFQKAVPMDFIEIYQRFADSINAGINELSNQQKMNAILNHVLNEEH
jgi:Skp family chaperone for outer membrane proteins